MTNTTANDLQESDVQYAFEHEQFSVAYQAQVDLNSPDNFVGMEAFVRLNHAEFGQMVPGTFLSLVRESGRMLELTKVVLAQVAKDWTHWNSQGFKLNISVNIDDSILTETNIGKELGSVLSEFNIPKHQLTLEFSSYLQDEIINAEAGKKLLGLRMKGYNLALDDYGVGMVAVDVVNNLPLDEIKINQQTINNLLVQEQSQTAARNAIRLAASYGMRVVAVGVETEQQADWLMRNGCDRAQGYLFGKPVSADVFSEQFLKNRKEEISQHKRLSVLIIEDDPQYQNLLLESLSEQYDIHIASNIKQAETLLHRVEPEIIISDVNLPDGSGIDFCKLKLESEIMKDASILFISGGKDFNNKFEAYEAGAMDYIEKPFSIMELIAKIKQVATYQSRRKVLVQGVDDAHSMATQSLKDAAYYGDIVQFYKNLLHCQDEQQMAKELFRFMGQKNLNTAIEFRSNNSCSNFDQQNSVCSAIEINLFELLKNNGRLFEFGKRIIVNDKHVSFLIKKMPDDAGEQGRIRDYIAVLAEGMEARYRDILRQRVLNTVMQQLQVLAHKLLDSVEKENKDEIMETFSLDLKMSFHVLDLSETQEQYLAQIIDDMIKRKDGNEHSASDIGNEVKKILESMEESMENFEETALESTSDDIGDSVELF
jgi:EAL domain-containing protein (putative c-di-GMP-specific phosphodiesterase class I)/DNA-binding response OmpR family regulator